MAKSWEEMLKKHGYSDNPYINQYLAEQHNMDLTIRRRSRAFSGHQSQPIMTVSIGGSGQPIVDTPEASTSTAADDMVDHERCITPAPDNGHTDIDCLICQSPAINPMVCTHPSDRNRPIPAIDADLDERDNGQSPQHLMCYQCLSVYMLHRNSPVVACPVGCGNEYALSRLVTGANSAYCQQSDLLDIACQYCGLHGSPRALANHICANAPANQIGHTLRSRRVQDLEATVAAQQATIAAQQVTVAAQQLQINALKADIQRLTTEKAREEEKALKFENKYDKAVHDLQVNAPRIQAAERTNLWLLSELADRDNQVREHKQQVLEYTRWAINAHEISQQRLLELYDENTRLIERLYTLVDPGQSRFRPFLPLNLTMNGMSAQEAAVVTTPTTPDGSLGIQYMFNQFDDNLQDMPDIESAGTTGAQVGQRAPPSDPNAPDSPQLDQSSPQDDQSSQ